MNSYKKSNHLLTWRHAALPHRQGKRRSVHPRKSWGIGVKLKRSPPAAQLRDGEAGIIDNNEMYAACASASCSCVSSDAPTEIKG
jgi:hypothetical protein